MESSVEKESPKRKPRTLKLKYLGLAEDQVLDAGVAIAQSAYVLDLAGEIATYNQDIEKLMDLADQWLKIATIVDATCEVEDEEEDLPAKKNKQPFGFVAVEKAEISHLNKANEDGEDGEDESDASFSGTSEDD